MSVENLMKLLTVEIFEIYIIAVQKAIQYSPASEIVPHIMQVNSSDFWYNYFICNTTMNETRQPFQYTHFKHSQLIAESNSEYLIILYLVDC